MQQVETEANIEVNRNQIQSEADRNLDVLRSALKSETDTAVAEARNAKDIEHAKQRQEYVKQVDMKNVVTAEAELTIAKIKMSKEKLESNGESSADLLAERNIADCVRVKAQAESEVVKKIGEANASATLAVGSAQGHVMKLEAAA